MLTHFTLFRTKLSVLAVGIVGLVSTIVTAEESRVERYIHDCDQGSIERCLELGAMFEWGAGVQQDTAHAISIFEPICSDGEPSACLRLSRIFDRDPDLSRKWLALACDDGVLQDSCGPTSYEGTPLKDMSLSDLKQACANDDKAFCLTLGVRLEFDETGQRDVPRAISLYRHACDEGDMSGCSLLGSVLLQGRGVGLDKVRALELLTTACSSDAVAGCLTLGVMYLEGDGVPRSVSTGTSILEQACSRRSTMSCHELGWLFQTGMYGLEANHERSASYYARSCVNGLPLGCLRLKWLWDLH